ncbi:unnamed protein product [Prorocentrum cordatum]|uniref:Uncharacterized protein n=1 Tax=Prorocentrum cordatum TaxID=2364126 RepID=A0ABN9Y2G8_9DINO|nr:unnamed protein product [Polarella glacialis]
MATPFVSCVAAEDRYWDLLSEFLIENEDFVPCPESGGERMSEGKFVEDLLTKEKYCDISLPRIAAAQRRPPGWLCLRACRSSTPQGGLLATRRSLAQSVKALELSRDVDRQRRGGGDADLLGARDALPPATAVPGGALRAPSLLTVPALGQPAAQPCEASQGALVQPLLLAPPRGPAACFAAPALTAGASHALGSAGGPLAACSLQQAPCRPGALARECGPAAAGGPVRLAQPCGACFPQRAPDPSGAPGGSASALAAAALAAGAPLTGLQLPRPCTAPVGAALPTPTASAASSPQRTLRTARAAAPPASAANTTPPAPARPQPPPWPPELPAAPAAAALAVPGPEPWGGPQPQGAAAGPPMQRSASSGQLGLPLQRRASVPALGLPERRATSVARAALRQQSAEPQRAGARGVPVRVEVLPRSPAPPPSRRLPCESRGAAGGERPAACGAQAQGLAAAAASAPSPARAAVCAPAVGLHLASFVATPTRQGAGRTLRASWAPQPREPVAPPRRQESQERAKKAPELPGSWAAPRSRAEGAECRAPSPTLPSTAGSGPCSAPSTLPSTACWEPPAAPAAGTGTLPAAGDPQDHLREELRARGERLQELFWQELDRARARLRDAGFGSPRRGSPERALPHRGARRAGAGAPEGGAPPASAPGIAPAPPACRER